MSRVLSAARIQLVSWPTTLSWPWGILASSLAVNVLLFASIGEIPEDATTGGLGSIYIVTFIASLLAISQDFPFAVGLSLTRRVFYAGLSLLTLGQSLAFGAILFLLRVVEDATGGWGIGLAFFGLPFLTDNHPLLQILIYAVPFVALGYLGTCIGLVYKRWNVTGLFALTLATLILVGGLVVLVTWQRWWGAVGDWLGDQPSLALFAGWPALLTLALAGAGYLLIRRTDP